MGIVRKLEILFWIFLALILGGIAANHFGVDLRPLAEKLLFIPSKTTERILYTDEEVEEILNIDSSGGDEPYREIPLPVSPVPRVSLPPLAQPDLPYIGVPHEPEPPVLKPEEELPVLRPEPSLPQIVPAPPPSSQKTLPEGEFLPVRPSRPLPPHAVLPPPGALPHKGPPPPVSGMTRPLAEPHSGRPTDKSAHLYAKVKQWFPPPPGFFSSETFNFLLYRQNREITKQVQDLLEGVHGNLMLDLVPFTLVKKPERNLVMMFVDKMTYASFTSRPEWSGASIDLATSALYIIEGKGFYSLSIHEMTHLYFDGFFYPKRMPLWISEGMAMYVQVNASKETPYWLEQGLKKIEAGSYFKIDEFVEVQNLDRMSDENVYLWYSQAYSLVNFLLNHYPRDNFYQFCINMRDGMPPSQALYRAYGLPFTKFGVLETLWLHNLQKPAENKNV